MSSSENPKDTATEEKNTDSVTSLITEREEGEAKLMIEGALKFPPPRACGYHLVVKLYVEEKDITHIRDEHGRVTPFIKPEVLIENEKWRSCVGLVIAKGPSCYRGQGEKYTHSGPWCKVGDWIMFPRHEGTYFVYRGIPMYMVPDDRVYMIVDDPSYIKRD